MRNSCCLAFETWRAKATALSAWASVKRACSKNTSPSSVNSTLRFVRFKSRTPTSSSKSLICWLRRVARYRV